jgi:hypothetical protein
MPKAPPSDAPAQGEAVAQTPWVPAAVPPPDPTNVEPLREQLGALEEEDDWLSVGYYGFGGSGKTTDLCAMARRGPMLLVSAESGAKVKALQRQGIPTDNIHPWPDPKKGEEITFASFEQLYYRVKADLLRDPDSWFGIGFDSLSEIVRLLIIDERTREYHRLTARGKERKRYFTDRDDYGAVTAMVGEKLRQFRNLPCHFGFTALERRDDDGFYGPSANPGIANDLPGFVDLLIHCERQTLDDGGDAVYLGWTKEHDKYRAKDRYGWLPLILPDPQFDRLLAWVREDLTPASDDRLVEVRARRAAIANRSAETAAAS